MVTTVKGSVLPYIVSVEQYTTGDGVTDDTSGITAAIASAAGGVLMFDGSKTYAISQITFNQSCTVITNGCTFKLNTGVGATSPAINITANNLTIDHLNVDNTGTETTRHRMIALTGCDNLQIGKVTLSSTATSAGAGSSLNAGLRISALTNATIGSFEANNFDFPIRIADAVDGLNIPQVSITAYVMGINIRQGKNVRIGSGGCKIITRSANGNVTPGHNGILIGNEGGANYATEDITIYDAYIRNSGEHGIRLSGTHKMRRISLIRPNISLSGASGIKVLSGSDGVYNEEIIIESPRITDVLNEDTPNTKLSCGIQFYRVIDSVITNPVLSDDGAAGTDFEHGISLYDVAGVIITNPQISGITGNGISVRRAHGSGDEGDTGGTYTITGITVGANPTVTVADTTGLTNGDAVSISGVVGTMSTVLNGNIFTVSNVTATTFDISTVDTTGLTYTSGGTATETVLHDCNQLKIYGGLITTCGGAGIHIPVGGLQHRGLVIDGTILRANTGYGLDIESTGYPSAGQLDNGSIRVFLDANTAGSINVDAAVGNTSKIHVNASGQAVTNTNMALGSQQHDEAGSFKILKSGPTWTAL